MLRVLFILLAVLSAIVAYLLDKPVLYAAAGVLLVIAFVLLVVQAWRGHQKTRKPAPARPAAGVAGAQDDDLNALGIMEIRPRERKGEAASLPERASAAEAEAEADALEPVPAAASPPTPANGVAAQPVIAVKKKRAEVLSGPVGDDKAAVERRRRELLVPYLQAMQAAVGANTVCLLRQEDGSLRYEIEAIVSKNSYAHSQGYFTTKTPLFPERRGVHLMRVGGEKGLAPASLGYYIEPIAVRQVAVVEVAHPLQTATYALLADAMDEGGLGAPWQRTLLSRAADLLGLMFDPSAAAAIAEAEHVPEVRPRRDIIAEEMEKARDEARPLALALVYLNQAEERAAEDAVEAAEQVMASHLREAAGSHRVERFGELTYGVFFEGGIAEVEAWALGVQQGLATAEGPLEGGVSIGVALLQDRHDSPDAFRADATDALRAAFESGACTILE